MKLQPLFSDADSDLRDKTWRSDKYGYPRTNVLNPNQPPKYRTVYAHHIVLERILGRSRLPGEITDHVNGNKIDVRRNNIRATTKSGNGQNRAGLPFRGTTLHRCGKWQAQVTHLGKKLYLGLFENREAAVAAAKEKRSELLFLSNTP